MRLDIEKAIQAAAVLLRIEEKRMSRVRLLKLLYIADRRSLKETGQPILGSAFVAMKYGPLHSEVLNLIKGQHIAEPQWSSHFTNHGRDVELSEEPGVSRLSRREVGVLHRVCEELINENDFDVVELTHHFPEYENCYDPGSNTSVPIPLADVLVAVGREDDKEEILKDIATHESYTRLFEGLREQ